MYIVMGGTGHVGSATAKTLLEQGHPVTIVTRDAAHADDLHACGAEISVADLHDVDAMRDVFRSGERLFLLNPPADITTDTDAVEKHTIGLLLAAVEDSGLEKIVAESTYGAQPGEDLGDLNTLYELEQRLDAQSIPHNIIRAAYYMSNWDGALQSVMNDGVLPTMYPADFELPMVAPADLGKFAAELLTGPMNKTGTYYVEGPLRYSSNDVAHAFEKAIGHRVETTVIPRSDWEKAYRGMGFSDAAARSYARMTAITADDDFATPSEPVRGSTTLETYIARLV